VVMVRAFTMVPREERGGISKASLSRKMQGMGKVISWPDRRGEILMTTGGENQRRRSQSESDLISRSVRVEPS